MSRVAYSLVRYSDPQQREGDSKRRQSEFAPRWCQEHGVRLDDSLTMLLDGQSAFRGHHRRHTGRKVRPLAEFLDHIKTGRVSKGSILIMENIDRLSREEIDEAWEFFRSILKAGVDVVTESPLRHYTKESLNDLFSILEVKFVMYRAHDESLQKSKRVRAAWEKKKEEAAEKRKPLTRNCPAWISFDEELGYQLIENRASIVLRIFQMALSGLGAYRIMRILTDENVPCFGRKKRWLVEYIRTILRSPSAYGAYAVGKCDPDSGRHFLTGKIVRDYYPAAVDEPLWLAVQHSTRERFVTRGRPGSNEANLFTSILFDADSRQKLRVLPTMRQSASGPKCYRYLVPAGRSNGLQINYGFVQDGLVRILSDLRSEHILPPSPEVDLRLQKLALLTKEVLSLADRLTILEAQQNDPSTDQDLLPSVQRGIIEVRRCHKMKAKELQQLEDEVQTNQSMSLGACQSALELLDTPQRRLAAKTRIRQLVESFWIVVQSLSRFRRIIHVQIYFRSGQRVYRRILPPNPPSGIIPWSLGDCDFRAGDVGYAARNSP